KILRSRGEPWWMARLGEMSLLSGQGSWLANGNSERVSRLPWSKQQIGHNGRGPRFILDGEKWGSLQRDYCKRQRAEIVGQAEVKGEAGTMTEAELDGSTDFPVLLESIQHQLTVRKARLFACACCRNFWPLGPRAEERQAVEIAEAVIDGRAHPSELSYYRT